MPDREYLINRNHHPKEPMEPTKDIVKIKLPTPISIDPTLNNGKTEAAAGEEFFTTAAAYTTMMGWEGIERIGDFISRDDLPALDTGGMTAPAIVARIKADAEKKATDKA